MGNIPKKLLKKIEINIDRIGNDLREFLATDDGDYLQKISESIPISHIFSWTQSFFTGIALLAYIDTKNQKLLDWALQFKEEYYAKVFETPMETMHDLGFLYSPYAVLLYELTGEKEFMDMGIRAAELLAMRYEPKGGYIRAWGRMDYEIPDYVDKELARNHFFTESKGLAIIDCMMNIPLLFWASKVTGHPFFKRIAMMHADTTLKYFIRDDYSVMHAYRFDEESGLPLGEENYCGYQKGSHWARGTAWAIYGFAIAYRYTREKRYYDAACSLLGKYMELCGTNVPIWDFRLPKEEEQAIDTSANAIVLCGAIELNKIKPQPTFEKYISILRQSVAEYINYDDCVMGILKEQNGKHKYASFGDYFIIESFIKASCDVEVW